MDAPRIAELLQPFLDGKLSEIQLQHISAYIDLLGRWNARINLTAIRDPEEIVTRHFGESLFLGRHLFPEASVDLERAPPPALLDVSTETQRFESQPPPSPDTSAASLTDGLTGEGARPTQATTVLDIGSGAGFPGLPLKIWNSAVSLTLVESNHKKATFLREVIRTLTLTDVEVVTDRAEALVDRHSKPDVVTFRAVERFAAILPVAANLVSPSGRMALLISSAQLSVLESLGPSVRWLPPIPVPQSETRILSISVPH